MTEDEVVGRHHRLDGHESEQALEVGDTFHYSLFLARKINGLASPEALKWLI